ncbi:hypothetical protein SEENIN0B_01125 [Salmonella enterica subsp. enterica serovar Infantis str. SARB27]|uniref:Uncharacterized protein n=1 Tax=Salmonella enterica subsp. enterica serovar Infantis str. SARB27 TaxID=596155 RepID=A0A6C8G5P5_SALIN|nr:hypothetical protein SEENIN0B_01125 [Salmonella enterica subsp. enterica serovar Infantis str. SARB27]
MTASCRIPLTPPYLFTHPPAGRIAYIPALRDAPASVTLRTPVAHQPVMTVITVMVRPLIAAAHRARRDTLSLFHQVAVPIVTVHVSQFLFRSYLSLG